MISTWAEHVAKDDTVGLRSRECLAGLRALRDPRVCFLGLVQSCFEAAGFAFMFLWTGSVDVAGDWHPPLGLIFGCFMLAVMLGGCVARLAVAQNRTVPWLLSLALPSAAAFLAVGFLASSPAVLFVAFVLYQVCVGVYFPSVGTLRAYLIPDTSRAAVMGWLRVPLNILAILILLLVSSVSHSTLYALSAFSCLAATGLNSILSRSLPPEILQPPQQLPTSAGDTS
jgi:MFS transporter, MFS domain-containing protein family, molybdate-anion transporter